MQAETALAEANRLIAELQGKQVISDKWLVIRNRE
jgi:hypothetical protein